MLFPQTNQYRQTVDLSGFWDFRFDPDGIGEVQGWFQDLKESAPIAVPASWNNQFSDSRDYLGLGWYQTHFSIPWDWDGKKIFIRFGSVNYLASVWLNGKFIGQHEGGHLPFEFDITKHIHSGKNLLVVCVDGALAPDRVPPGNVPPDPRDVSFFQNYPASNFDFFPFCGIHRPVWIYAKHPAGIDDLIVATDVSGTTGIVKVKLISTGVNANVDFFLGGHGTQSSQKSMISNGQAETEFVVPDAALWEPGAPNLYTLKVELSWESHIIDQYELSIGIRSISIRGDALLLNGKPIQLKGFGRHEDFPVIGRGYFPAVIIKDYSLLQWVGANSFRTSHYPYSEEMLDLADKLGFLVIAETPAVGLFFAKKGLAKRNRLCTQYVQELIKRDRNHPSVIIWSLANEPHSRPGVSTKIFKSLYDQAKSLDPTRPVTLVSDIGVDEEALEFLDIICLNRYCGWYTESAQLDLGLERLSTELDAIYEKYPKPFILTEFGADAIPGIQSDANEVFSEEYQAEMILRTIQLLNSKPYVVGQHIWNLCDFKTTQSLHRAGGTNYKGVFTRDRRPKLAAQKLRELWFQKDKTNQ
ncbi:MAG: beta-glucuronidase [Anaerolineales bacterium]